MSRITTFNTRFWQDDYISNLDPTEKLLFIYLLTGSFLSLSGIYEVPLKYMAMETGLDRDMVMKILDRFEKDNKTVFRNGWLCILNYPKHQSYNLPRVKQGLQKELDSIPHDLLSLFIEKGLYTKNIANELPTKVGNKVQVQVQVQDKEQVKEQVKEQEDVPKIVKNKYGEFQNVLLTDEEYSKLVESLNENAVETLIAELGGYIASTGKRYKSHYATIQNWARRRIKEYSDKMKPDNKIKKEII